MIILKIELLNFKSFEYTNITFQEGLTGIIGSNGAGKSTIFDAIKIGLFGFKQNLFNKEYLRWQHAEQTDTVRIVLSFEHENSVYTVLREWRGKNLTSYSSLKDNQNIEIANGTKNVNSEIEKIIGMNDIIFNSSIFASQKELGILTNAQPAERKKIIRKMIGMDKIDNVQKNIRTDLRSLKEEIKVKSTFLLSEDKLKEIQNTKKGLTKEKRELIKRLKDLRKKLKIILKEYKKSKKEFELQQKLFRDYTKINNSLISIKKNIENLKNNLDKNKKKHNQIQTYENDLMIIEPQEKTYHIIKKQLQELDELQKKAIELNNKCDLSDRLEKQLNMEKKKLKYVQTKYVKYNEYDKKYTEIQYDIQKTNLTIKQFEYDKDKYNKDISELSGLQKKWQQDLNNFMKLGNTANCPTCFRPLKDTYNETITRFKNNIEQYTKKINLIQIEKLDNINQKLNEHKKNLLKLQETEKDIHSKLNIRNNLIEQMVDNKTEIESLNKELKKIANIIKKIGNIDYDEKKHNTIKKEFNNLEVIHKKYETLSIKVQEKEDIHREIKTIKSQLKQLDKDKHKYQTKLDEINYSDNKYNETKVQVDKIEIDKDDIIDNINSDDNKKKDIQFELNEIKKSIDENKKIKNDLKESDKKVNLLKKLDVYFEKFKDYVLEIIRPNAGSYASELFSEITEGKYDIIEVDTNFDFYIHDNGQPYPINRFSGGEIDLANLCIRIGLSKSILALTNTEYISFLGFDEIFGSQDQKRRFQIIDALNKIKDKFRQIFVISHVEEMKNEFPQLLHIEKYQNKSNINHL